LPSEPLVALDPRNRRLHDDTVLLSPTGRLLRLKPHALDALGRNGKLAAQLVDAGAAHPTPGPVDPRDVTVVIPVRDRLDALDRCLAAVDHDDVLVIDDGSLDAAGVERVCAGRARVARRANGGPAAARNTALPLLDKDFVAFLDSDCAPPAGWLRDLRGHLEDPAVGAVAPRVTGGLRSPLDLGTHPALVRPGTAVAYVPTAALLVRRSALSPFDEGLRYGEDVDLVWRMVEAGWQVRYDPRVVVDHEEPVRLQDRLVRRFHYGTSAAPLEQRHPGAVTHLVAPPLPTAAVALLLLGRPALAAVATAAVATRLDRHLHDPAVSGRVAAQSVKGTAEGLGRAASMLGPVAWAAAARRPALAALLALPWALEQRDHRPGGNPLAYVGAALLDQAAYGAGVLTGCLRTRRFEALRPRVR
jgi:mycofactocin system glycosyltransferase